MSLKFIFSKLFLALSWAFLLLITQSSVVVADSMPGTWVLTGPFQQPPVSGSSSRGPGMTFTLLNSGKVLAVGGTWLPNAWHRSVQLYDPSTGLWSLTGGLVTPSGNTGRTYHSSTLLNNGQVLVAGGKALGHTGTSSTEIYNPSLGIWTIGASMSTSRAYATATALNDGRILVAGGCDVFIITSDCIGTTSVELYDPATGLWSQTDSMNVPRQGHAAVLLPDGTVLVIGSDTSDAAGESTKEKAEIYDPVTGGWTNVASMTVPRSHKTATLMPDGRVLVAGGVVLSADNRTILENLNSSEIYDPSLDSWINAAPLNLPHYFHTATLLANGRILVTGGGPSGSVRTAELYHPESDMWEITGPLNTNRSQHQAMLLLNGQVLVGGSGSTTELYIPDVYNHPPVLSAIENKIVFEGQALSFVVNAFDPDGDELLFAVSNLPAGATFDPQSRVFSWTPTYAQAGNYPDIEFTVSDDGSPMMLDLETITITVGDVNRSPVFTAIGSQQVLEHETLAFIVSATDPDGDSVSLSAIGMPSGATFNSSTGEFSWTPAYPSAGVYTPTFVAMDNGLPITTSSIDVVITVGSNPTPTEATESLIDTVVDLDLPNNVENQYLQNLNKTNQYIETGRTDKAINELNKFINKVNNDYSQGTITLVERDALIAMAQAIIVSLQ